MGISAGLCAIIEDVGVTLATDSMWLQQAGGIAGHQQDKQQERQADAHCQRAHRAVGGTLVPDKKEQAAEQAPDNRKQDQDNKDFCVHE
jgi:hypothetical protein